MAAWILWLAAWLCRVERRARAAPLVDALGLAFSREGWGPTVLAAGQVGGAWVTLRFSAFSWSLSGAARVGEGAPWSALPPAAAERWIRAAVATRVARTRPAPG